jgi:hypothetical protein
MPEYVATLAHHQMSEVLYPDWTKTQRVLHFREKVWRRAIRSGADEYKMATDWIRNIKSLQPPIAASLTVFDRSTQSNPRWLWIGLENCPEGISTGDFKIDGPMWLCFWGEHEARYGRMVIDGRVKPAC